MQLGLTGNRTSMRAGRRLIASIGVLVVVGAFLLAMGAIDDRGGGTQERGDKMLVAATIPPLAMIAEEVVGEDAVVETILPAGSSPHTFEPRPGDIARVQDAEIVFEVGESFDDHAWARDLFDADVMRSKALETLDLERTRRVDDSGHGHSNGEEDAGFEGDDPFDPHVWLSPENAGKLGGEFARVAGQVEPDLAAAFEDRAKAFSESVLVQKADLNARLEPFGEQRLVTLHDSWGSFAFAFGMEIVGALELTPGRVPSPSELADLETSARERDATLVVSEPQLSSDSIESFACDIGTPLIEMDPLGGTDETATYAELMEYNVRQIEVSAASLQNPCD